jgi:hypothetical protein
MNERYHCIDCLLSGTKLYTDSLLEIETHISSTGHCYMDNVKNVARTEPLSKEELNAILLSEGKKGLDFFLEDKSNNSGADWA